jgi:hypothetical protein
MRFGIMALAVTASLMLSASVQARGPGSIHFGNKGGVSNSFSHHDFGHRTFSGGTYYRGIHHNHWSYTYWDSRYGCYLYWDPYYTCYYYWCVPAGCYYPVGYCPYNTYSWQQPVGGVLPAPVVDVPRVKTDVVVNVKNIQGATPTLPGTAPLPADVPPVVDASRVKTNVLANVKNIQGPAPTPGSAQLPPDVPPPPGGPMVPVR